MARLTKVQGYKKISAFWLRCEACGKEVNASRAAAREHEKTRTHLEATEGKTLPNHAVLAADRPVIGRATASAATETPLSILEQLIAWQEYMGGFEAEVWQAAKRTLDAALADAIKRGTPTNPTQHNGGTIADLERIVSELPNDPEEMNEARAAWAAYALAAFGASHRSDPDSLVPDLLCNLRHWCDRNGQDFDAELARGNMHYEAEIAAEVQP